MPSNQQQFLDMVDIPFWTGRGPYPSVKVRMDFRGPDVGDFVYHCQILEHEDKGMMATIRVLPPGQAQQAKEGKHRVNRDAAQKAEPAAEPRQQQSIPSVAFRQAGNRL